MKFIIGFSVLIFILNVISCSDDQLISNNGNSNTSSYQLNGQIHNWVLGEKKVILRLRYADSLMVVVDSAYINQSGSFSFSLSDVDSSYLGPLFYNNIQGCSGNVSINPPDTRGCIGEFFVVNDSILGMIRYERLDSTISAGYFTVNYGYVNKSVSVTGAINCVDSLFSSFFNYNWHSNKGWSKTTNKCTQVTASSWSWVSSNEEPINGVWRFYPFY